MRVPALPADFNDCLCHIKNKDHVQDPCSPTEVWEQPGWTQLLTWKTSTCAPGTWLVFVPDIHRQKKFKKPKHLAPSLV